jgi:hypothetical protein
MQPVSARSQTAGPPTGESRALLISADPSRAERFVPILVHAGLEVHQVAHVAQAERLVRQEAFRLVVLVEPVPSIGVLLEKVRGAESRCRHAGIILAASREELAQAERLPVRPNRVVRIDRLEVEGRLRVNDLLNVAPRAGVQAWVRLTWRLGERTQHDLAETVNLSTTGMLLRGCGTIPVGSKLKLEIIQAADQPPISGTAEVVRHARKHRDAAAAVALRFLRLEGDGRARLARLVARSKPTGEAAVRAEDDPADPGGSGEPPVESRVPTPPMGWVRSGSSLHRAVESVYGDDDEETSADGAAHASSDDPTPSRR